jgi:ATP-dependent Zn protease
MNKTVKVILNWVLILVLAVGLYTFVERGTQRVSTQLTLTDLMEKVDREEVRDVTIRGSNLVGHLKDDASTEFRSVIPPDYTTIYDRLTSKSVNVKILPPDVNPWLGVVPTSLLIGGSILWFAISVVILVLLVDLSRFVKRELARSAGRPSAS